MILFKLAYFKRAALKFAFNHQSKPVNFAELRQSFIDSEGRGYYSYDDDLKIPLERKGKISTAVIELMSALTKDELSMFRSAMHTALDKAVTGKKGVSGIAEIGYLLHEMDTRADNIIHEDILFDMAAYVYIREDENPSMIDIELHEAKIKQFRKDAAGGLRDFFYSDGLRRYIPFSDMSEEQWNAALAESKIKLASQKKMIEALSSVPAS